MTSSQWLPCSIRNAFCTHGCGTRGLVREFLLQESFAPQRVRRTAAGKILYSMVIAHIIGELPPGCTKLMAQVRKKNGLEIISPIISPMQQYEEQVDVQDQEGECALYMHYLYSRFAHSMHLGSWS